MVEKVLLDYLTENLEVPVYMEKPAEHGKTYVLIEKTGSTTMNKIYSPVVAVQSYAPTLYEAAALNEEVKEAVFSSVSLDSISAVRLNSDYNFTDTSTKEYRYQSVFVITYLE